MHMYEDEYLYIYIYRQYLLWALSADPTIAGLQGIEDIRWKSMKTYEIRWGSMDIH